MARSKKVQATARSTAAIFQSAQPEAEVSPSPTEPEPVAAPAPADDDPSQYGFPLNLVYTVQDFLNDHMNVRAFVQLLIVAYTCNLIYINHESLVMQHYQLMGFNFVGIALALILSHYTRSKKHAENPRVAAPELPEFNHFYLIFLPTALTLLVDPQQLLVTLATNYFIADALPMTARLVCAFMFYWVYTEDSVVSFATLQHFALYVVINYLLTYVNRGSPETAMDVPQVFGDEQDSEEEELAKIRTLNRTRTIGTGESLLRSECHLLTLVVVKVLTSRFPLTTPAAENRYIPLIILQKLLVSFLVLALVNYPAFRYLRTQRQAEVQLAKALSLLLAASFVTVFILLTHYQLEPILGTLPLVWLYPFIVDDRERLQLVTQWALVLAVSIVTVFVSSYHLLLNSRRKIWHSVILLILLISEPLQRQPLFTLVSLCGTLAVLLGVEVLRYNKFTFIGQTLYDQLIVFQDSKDLLGPLNCLYIFLLLGTTLPIIADFYSGHDDISIYSYLGLVFLGVGDLTALIIGKSLGTLKWKGSYKSVQGTISFFVASFAAFFALDYFLSIHIDNWENIFITCLLGSLLEGASDMNDNFLIPCFTYVILKALNH
jgi:dolichol kinase